MFKYQSNKTSLDSYLQFKLRVNEGLTRCEKQVVFVEEYLFSESLSSFKKMKKSNALPFCKRLFSLGHVSDSPFSENELLLVQHVSYPS